MYEYEYHGDRSSYRESLHIDHPPPPHTHTHPPPPHSVRLTGG